MKLLTVVEYKTFKSFLKRADLAITIISDRSKFVLDRKLANKYLHH